MILCLYLRALPELVSASLCEWALSTGRSYIAGLRAGPSVSGLDGAISLLTMVPLGVCPSVQVFGDSELVTQQVKRAWRPRNPSLISIFEQAISNVRARGCRLTFTQLPSC